MGIVIFIIIIVVISISVKIFTKGLIHFIENNF